MSESDKTQRRTKSQRRASRQAVAQQRARQRRMMIWAGAAVAIAILLVATLVFLNQEDDEEPLEPVDTTVLYGGIPTDGRYLGDPEAPVDFVVYSDFQCPFCEQFDTQDLPEVIENFVRPGEVRVEFRGMPIISQEPLDSPDNESVQALEAAMCAAEQDQFWPYQEAMFNAQEAENSGVYSDDMLKQTAEDLELDTDAFNECLDSGEMEDDVIAIREDGIERGVNGTPTFLINDQLVSYTREGYDRLEDQLNQALEGELVDT